MSWWRTHWRLGLAFVVTGLGLFLLILLYAMRKQAEAEKLQAQLGLMNTSLKVASLEADKQARARELAANQVEAEKLDQAIAEAKRQTVDVVENVKGMSDAEVAEAFKRLGY